MKKRKLALLAMVVASLGGCGKGDYDFAGKYFAMEGEACATPSSSKDREQYFLELTRQVHDGKASYTAKFPVASRAGAPITSAQAATATDQDELSFNFSKAEVAGMFSASPAVDIVITVVPNKDRAGHLWLTKAQITAVRGGKVNEVDLISGLRNTGTAARQGLCLKKAAAPG